MPDEPKIGTTKALLSLALIGSVAAVGAVALARFLLPYLNKLPPS